MSQCVFENNVLKKIKALKEKKILVCMSGGLDSTVLAHLLLKIILKFLWLMLTILCEEMKA